MNIIKKLFCSSMLFLFCFLPVSAQDDKNVSWQFALYNSEGPVIGSDSPSEPLAVSEGRQFRLGLSSRADAFCYIADEQPDGTVNVIFNGIVKDSAYLNLPGENQFFTLQPPDGTERFHDYSFFRPSEKT